MTKQFPTRQQSWFNVLIAFLAMLLIGVGVFVVSQHVPQSSASGVGAGTKSNENTSVSRDGIRVHEIRFGVNDPPVVAQRDITVRYQTSNTQLEAKPLECAALRFVPDKPGADGKPVSTGRLLILSDRHDHVVFSCRVDLAKMQIGVPKPSKVIANEQNLFRDGEAMLVKPRNQNSEDTGELTSSGFRGYIFTSLSNDRSETTESKRRHFARFDFGGDGSFTPTKPVVIDASSVREQLTRLFEKAGVVPYRTYFGEFPGEEKNTYRWANVEGIAILPNRPGELICGMRNPLVKGRAMLFVMTGLDEAFDKEDAKLLKVTDLFSVDLGGRGISDMCWDAKTRGFLIAAAKSNGLKKGVDQVFPPNTLDSALFWWSGRKSEKPVLFAHVPDMKIEAICRLGGSRFIAIGSDEGDVSEGREGRQSVLTVMDFTGIRRVD